MNDDVRQSLYQQLLGADFDRMPDALRELHRLSSSSEFAGDAEVIAGDHWLARLLALCTGLPTRSRRCRVRVRVRIDIDPAGETWHRDFDGHRFHSRMSRAKAHLVERLGPHRIGFQLQADANGLRMLPVSWRLLGIPLPRALWPRVDASEQARDGRFHFDVATSFPWIGRVVHYRGWLQRA